MRSPLITYEDWYAYESRRRKQKPFSPRTTMAYHWTGKGDAWDCIGNHSGAEIAKLVKEKNHEKPWAYKAEIDNQLHLFSCHEKSKKTMQAILQKDVYYLPELSERAKAKILDEYRHINVQGIDWWDLSYMNAKHIGKCLGFNIKEIYHSGFSSQGDGACFVGNYFSNKMDIDELLSYAPQDKKLTQIGQGLMAMHLAEKMRNAGHPDRRNSHIECSPIVATFSHRGRYYREHSVHIDMRLTSEFDGQGKLYQEFTELCRDFMRWIYRRLESEYDYLISDELVAYTLMDNNMLFTEFGEFIK